MWSFGHFLLLGHETRAYTVSFSIFTGIYLQWLYAILVKSIVFLIRCVHNKPMPYRWIRCLESIMEILYWMTNRKARITGQLCSCRCTGVIDTSASAATKLTFTILQDKFPQYFVAQVQCNQTTKVHFLGNLQSLNIRNWKLGLIAG